MADGDPARLFEETCPDELFVAQSVLKELRRLLPGAPGEQRAGFLVGRRFRCPVTSDPYLLVDQVLSAAGALPGRHETARFHEALRRARDEAQGRGREVLGWFHNHSTLMGMRLSKHDLRLHFECFPEPWHCMAILVPDSDRPTGGFFQRRDRTGYPGTQLIPFFEVLDRDATEGWGTLTSQLDWVNYDTSRQGVRRPSRVTKTPAPPSVASPPRPTASPAKAAPAEAEEEPAPEVEAKPPAALEAPEPPEEAPGQAALEQDAEALQTPDERPDSAAGPAAAALPSWATIPRPYAAAPPEPAEEPVSPEAAEWRRAEPLEAPPESAEGSVAPEATGKRAPGPPRSPAAAAGRPRAGPGARRMLPFRLEPSEPSASPASLARAVSALRSVVASRRPAAADPRDELALHYSEIPVVLPPSEGLAPRWAALKARLCRRRRSTVGLLLTLAVAAGLLLGRGDRGESVAPSAFHPATGPPEGREAATVTGGQQTFRGASTRFGELHSALTARLAAYGERRQDFELGRIDCAGLAVGFRDVQRGFLQLSDYMASQQARLPAEEQTAYRGLVGQTAEVNRHFEEAGCRP